LTVYLSRPYGAPPEVRLELDITPDGIPRSGSMLVTSYLYNRTSDTRIVADSEIVMTATLCDGTKTIQTKNTTSGQASFSIPSDTAAIRFDARHLMYNGSMTLSGPTVVSESLASGIAISAAAGGFALAGAAWVWYDGGKVDRWRLLMILPGLAAGCLPLAYLLLNYPTWFGTAWFPYTFYGFPVWGFVIVTIIGGLFTGVMSKTTLKRKPAAVVQPEERPGKPKEN